MSDSWLIAGLGNPGDEYTRTRHNLGFRVADELARRHDIGFRRTRYRAQEGSGHVAGRSVRLLKPQTYMNDSGFAVNRAATFHKLPIERILIVYDDMDLPLARLRFREGGGSGGHNGIKSIVASLHGDGFWRLRIGVDRPRPEQAIDHVLTPFRKEEAPLIDEAIGRAADAVELFLSAGPIEAMNRFNG